MTAPTCPLDGKPIHDQAAICTACSADLEKALAELPGLLDDLELTLSRQTAQGQRHGGRSSEKALPYDVRASNTLDAARVVLVGWVNVLRVEPTPCEVYFCPQSGDVECPTHGGFDTCCLHPELHEPCPPEIHDTDPWPKDTPQSMARWLFARLDRARRHEAGAEIAVEIRDLSATIRRASDLAFYRSKFALGPCVNTYEDGSPCGGEVWAFIPADESRTAVMRCLDCRHEWPSHQWLTVSPEILRKAS